MADKFIVHAALKVGFKTATTIAVDKADFEWFDEPRNYSGMNSPTLFHLMCTYCSQHIDMRESVEQDTAAALSLTEALERIYNVLERMKEREE